MTQKYDIRSEAERAIHRAAYELAYCGETPERRAALDKALENSDVPIARGVVVKEHATLGGLALRAKGDTPSR